MTAIAKTLLTLALAALPALVGGCGSDAATLQLLTAAGEGLADARAAQQHHHRQELQRLESQKDALGRAFDNDVKLVSAGQITRPDGSPVQLTAEWTIAARKGYAAGLDLLTQQQLAAAENHAQRMDNLQAARECLDMAAELILQRQRIIGTVRSRLTTVYRRMNDGE